jgi:U3 small nucleolar RNA-associated protein 14
MYQGLRNKEGLVKLVEGERTTNVVKMQWGEWGGMGLKGKTNACWKMKTKCE